MGYKSKELLPQMALNMSKISSKPIKNNIARPGKLQERKIDLSVIGDIVYDKVLISADETENQPKTDATENQPKTYPGGALFVKNFLESDPAINSKANVHGYIESSEDNAGPCNNLYDINIPKIINEIPLTNKSSFSSKTKKYRINNSITIPKIIRDKNISFSFPKKSNENTNFSILVCTDLGIDAISKQGPNDVRDSKLNCAGIGRRTIPPAIDDNGSSKNYEWEEQFKIAYNSNKEFNNSSMPWHFITISHPTESLFEQPVYSFFKKKVIKPRDDAPEAEKEEYEMHQRLKEKTLAIVYGDHLRSGLDLAIAKRISIERTAQDFLQELHTNPFLSELGKFEHLVVRFGLLSVVHSYRIKNRRFHRLFFDPKDIYEPSYSTKVSGLVTGNQTLLLGNIVRQLLVLTEEEKKNPYVVTERIGVGIKQGIKDCKERYDNGYGDQPSEALEFLNPKPTDRPNPAFVPAAFTDQRKEVKNFEDEEFLASDIADERIPIAHPAWSILAQSAEYKLVQAAEKIVYNGVDLAVNHQNNLFNTIWSPIGRFGENKEMIVLERYELESYRSVQLLMEEAMTPENTSILSLAVFGPPGSGKSFVSRRIANSACAASNIKLSLETINLASITNSQQLTDKLDNAFNTYINKTKKNKEDKDKLQLIIFFDEFDCSINDKNLGWLKSFLPMMQDGEFSPTYNTHEEYGNYPRGLNQPILIFAGGTSHAYSHFSRQDSSGDPEDKLRFVQAKGPDFVSRLRGHIDILGPTKTSELDEGYVIRRAILLRTAFFNRFRQFKLISNDENTNLDKLLYKPLVRAMLTVSKYKHGARSMQAIIAMCGTLPGGRITAASMPPHAQLNMHVDANEFLKLIRAES